jgi:LacI family transcriptional regulator
MVSQQDIAEKLGVSQGLVSKVLGGRMGTTRVDPAVRKKIIRASEALGYLPNRNALGLFSGKHGAIALFFRPWGAEGTDFTRLVLEGMSAALQPTRYHIWLGMYTNAREFRRQLDIREMQNRVDGLLVGGALPRETLPLLRKVEKAGIPVVTLIEDYWTMKNTPNISISDRTQGQLATAHLIARGCRRIAHLSFRESRYKGYQDALRAAKLPLDPRLVVTAKGWSIEQGRIATRELLARKVAFDGIFAQSDLQAFGALQELQLRGVRVPEEVKLIGVDDSPICFGGPVSLSTVTSECHALGRAAVEAISRRLAGETVLSRTIPTRVIHRDSS